MKPLELSFPGVPPDPLAFWQRLHHRPHHGFFFGSGSNLENDHRVFMSAEDPIRVFKSNPGSTRDPLRRFHEAFRTTKSNSKAPRFVGFLGFEAGRTFDSGIGRLPSRPNPLKTPLALFAEYAGSLTCDLKRQVTTIYANDRPALNRLEKNVRKALSQNENEKKKSSRKKRAKASSATLRRWGFKFPSEKKFSSQVAAAKRAIGEGDIYQANISMRFETGFLGDPVALYRALCLKNPSPYACLIKTPNEWVVSCSPELLLSSRGRKLVTRPIAGTRPRGTTKRSDTLKRGQLLLSPKERAEHIMLVDLERNDLGRVSKAGSVKVPEKFSVEPYSHVMHIVSEVTGDLAPHKTSVAALRSLFPGGTITGCPKIKSIEIIENLEEVARGPFYGSAGFFSWNGDALFNILIRTAVVKNRRVYIQAGAGIVADSNPKREYKEALSKAQALLEAVWEINSK